MKPTILFDLPIASYVADRAIEGVPPSLNASIATLVVDRSPAHAFVAHPRLTARGPEEWSAAANFGSAVHSTVFGGPEVVTVVAEDWRTKAARERRVESLAARKIPLLGGEVERCAAIAARASQAILALGAETDSIKEATIIWSEGGAVCRCRPDLISADKRLVVDLKITGVSLGNGGANRQFFNQGYDMQAAFFERGLDALDLEGRGRRRIIYLFVESEPPHAALPLLVSEGTLMIARKRMNAAISIWKRCLAANVWPSYATEPVPTERPGWQEEAWLAREMNDLAVDVEAIT